MGIDKQAKQNGAETCPTSLRLMADSILLTNRKARYCSKLEKKWKQTGTLFNSLETQEHFVFPGQTHKSLICKAGSFRRSWRGTARPRPRLLHGLGKAIAQPGFTSYVCTMYSLLLDSHHLFGRSSVLGLSQNSCYTDSLSPCIINEIWQHKTILPLVSYS